MGREDLHRTLESVANQDLLPGDEVIVVEDGPQPLVEEILEAFPDLPIRRFVHGPTRDFGNSQREFASLWAHGEFIWFLDDDDIANQEALLKIRKAIVQDGLGVFVFKVKAPWGEIVWTDRGVIEQGNCCTIQMVVPNVRELLPPWPKRQGGNIPYLKAWAKVAPIFWRPEIIATARPEGVWW